MDFPRWFDTKYRREGEPLTRAAQRLSNETGLAWMTVVRAARGKSVRRGTAALLSEATKGEVSIDEICPFEAATGTEG